MDVRITYSECWDWQPLNLHYGAAYMYIYIYNNAYVGIPAEMGIVSHLIFVTQGYRYTPPKGFIVA